MVTIEAFYILIFVFFINEILTHLQNWWFREQNKLDYGNDNGLVALYLFSYVIKIAIIFLVIYNIT